MLPAGKYGSLPSVVVSGIGTPRGHAPAAFGSVVTLTVGSSKALSGIHSTPGTAAGITIVSIMARTPYCTSKSGRRKVDKDE